MPKPRSARLRVTKARRCLFGSPDHDALAKDLDEEIKGIIDKDTKRLLNDYTRLEPVPAAEVPTFYKRVRGQRVYVDDDGDERIFPRLAKSPPLVSPSKPEPSVSAPSVNEVPSTSVPTSTKDGSKTTNAPLPSPAKRARKENVFATKVVTRSRTRLFASNANDTESVDSALTPQSTVNDEVKDINLSTKERPKKHIQPCLTNYLLTERKLVSRQTKKGESAAIRQIDVRPSPASAPPSPLRKNWLHSLKANSFLIEETNTVTRQSYLTGGDCSRQGLPKSASTSRILRARILKSHVETVNED